MNRNFSSLRTWILATAGLPLALTACDGSVPEVHSQDAVLPEPSPMREMQAMSVPDAANADADESDAQRWCKDGELAEYQTFPDGRWRRVTNCAEGGGVASIVQEGQSDPVTGDGAYDETTILDDGREIVWHITIDVSDDGSSWHYVGHAAEGNDNTDSTYTMIAGTEDYEVHSVANYGGGTYVTDGVQRADGSWSGTTSFDDPDTERNPDWSYTDERAADGSGSQVVDYAEDGYSTHYTATYGADGSSSIEYATDLDETAVAPDYVGERNYNADGSGSGHYLRTFEDGSTTSVEESFDANGYVQSWIFDDIGTEQDVDQEGQMTWHADGSGEGTITFHVVNGGEQTCEVRVSADGVQTIDSCN